MQTHLNLLKPVKRHPTEISTLVLLALLYVPLLLHWIDGWLNKSISIDHEYFSYALIGLPYAAFIAWESRSRWHALTDRVNFLGLSLLVTGGIFYLSPVQNLINLSLPITLSGLVLLFKGLAGFKLLAFPLLFIALATPTDLPYLIAPYLLPLQKFIATVAGFILMQIGMNVTVDQIYILVNERIVEVAPYCAGLKMLMTCMYVALLILHRTGNIASHKKAIALITGAALISVMGNIIRNTFLTFFHGTGRTGLFEWMHDSWGGDVFSALLLLSVLMLMQGIDKAANTLSATPSVSRGGKPIVF